MMTTRCDVDILGRLPAEVASDEVADPGYQLRAREVKE
jgi:hypothetical protein